MNIEKKLKEKEEEFETLIKKRSQFQEQIQKINERLLILKGEYNILKELQEEKNGKKD